MLKRIYIHNFRCLENFDLTLGERSSVLLVGKNGSGKTSVALALEMFQKIARGTNRVEDLIGAGDITKGRPDALVRFEVEVAIDGRSYLYALALEYPRGFRALRVAEERLTIDGAPIYTRELSQIKLSRGGATAEAAFRIDWHLVGLPIVQERDREDPLYVFKNWLRSMLVMKPVPSLFEGDSRQATADQAWPNRDVKEIGDWFSSVMAAAPHAYADVSSYLSDVLQDFSRITNAPIGKDARSMLFHFERGADRIDLSLEELSDGEKCFVVFALTIATNSALGPLLCFWDEPDNFLSVDEVGHAVLALRRAFKERGQIILTSHNAEVIHRFPEADTLYLTRRSHTEPTTVSTIESLRSAGLFRGGIADALIRGDLAS